MSIRLSLKVLCMALVAVVVVSCWDDESAPTGPGAPAIDTTRRDTSKTDTSRKDAAKKDTTKVDTSKTIVGPASSDSLAPGQKSKDIQLGGVVGAGKSVTWVKFQGTSGHTYTYTYLPRGQGTLQVYLLNGKDTLAQVSTPRTGDSIVFPCTRAGTYLVRVVGPSGTKPTLKVGENDILPMYVVSGDGFEPDYDTAHASTWDFKNPTQYHTTHYTGVMDTDWVRIPVDSGTTLTLDLEGTFTMVPSIGRPQADLFEKDGQPTRWNGGNGNWTLAVFHTRVVYLRLCGSDTISMPYSLSISAKSGFPATAFLPDPYEPDQTRDKAATLGFDTSGQSRTLHGDERTDDVDWLRFQADSGTLYRVRVDTRNSEGHPPVDLLSKDGIRQILSDSLLDRWGASHSWAFACTRSADYFLRVQGGIATPYQLRLTANKGLPGWTAIPDSLEPDDTRAQAVALKKGELSFHRTITSGDVDWYVLEVDSGTIWSLRLHNDGTGSTNRIRGAVFDADSALVGTFEAQAKDEEIWSHQFPRSGKFHLSLTGAPRDGLLQIPYDLESYVVTGMDPDEPNESRSTATKIMADGSWRTRWLHPLDEDWLELHPQASSRVTLSIERSSALAQLGLIAYDSRWGGGNEVPIGSFWSQSGNVDSISFLVEKDTVMYLDVVAGNVTSAFTNWSYRIRARAEPVSPDGLEPDQTKTDAMVVPSDSSWIRRNLYPGDQDWMAIDAPAGMIVRMEVRSPALRSNPKLNAKVVTPAGTEQGLWSDNRSYSLRTSQAGRYWVQLYMEPLAPTVTDYDVRLWLENYRDAFEPDDDISQAKSLPMDSSSQPHWLMLGDTYDWIQVPSCGRARRFVRLKESYQGMPFECRRTDGSLVKSYNASEALEGVLLANTQDTSVYWLRVSSPYATEYVVRGWIVADPDPFEPSDSPLLAPLLSAAPTNRWITWGDTDQFRIHLDPGQSVGLVASGKVQWTLYSASGAKVDNELARGRYHQAGSAEDYLLKVLPSSNSTAFQPYSMSLVPMTVDTSVRHSTRSEAIVIDQADSTLRSALTSYSDTVWYRIHLDPGQNAVLQARSPGRIAVFTQDQKRLRDSLGSLFLFHRAGSDTALYVGFVPRRDTFQLMPISLRVSQRLEDAYEPDNSTASAASIDSGVWQERVLMENDTDFIRLPEAPEGTRWSLQAQFSEIDIGTEVTRDDGVGTGQNSYLSPSGSLTLTSKGPGPCYLRLVGKINILNPRVVGSRYRIRVVRP